MQLTLLQAQQIIQSPLFGINTLPTKIAYRFTKLARRIQGELKGFDEARQKLITECNGVLTEDGSQFNFSPTDAPAFAQGMNDLMGEGFDLESIWPMPIDELGQVELSPADLLILEPLFL